MCGASLGLQHNVYLAAFTFLAFMLTSFYAVHYWLKRCVPKVAEAFFVYMDGTENMLVPIILFISINVLAATVGFQLVTYSTLVYSYLSHS